MKIRVRTKRRARIEIIPMIDVIFFLLVFFMVSSLSMSKINSLPVNLPKTSAAPTAAKQNIVLTVQKNGSIFVNKTPVSMDSIGEVLAHAMENATQDPVLVNADEGVDYGLVMRVLDQARRIGVRKFSLATEASAK